MNAIFERLEELEDSVLWWVHRNIPTICRLWRSLRGRRLAALAGLFATAEVLVTSGIPLPYSDVVPVPLRLSIIGSIVFLRFYLGWRVQREMRRRGDGE